MSLVTKIITDLSSSESKHGFAFLSWINEIGGEGYKSYAQLVPILGSEEATRILREAFMAGIDFKSRQS